MIFSPIFVYLCLCALSSATPLLQKPRANRDLQPLKEAYRGIYWDQAAIDCSDEEFDILAEATRVALEEASFHTDGNVWESPAWNRYFGGLGGIGGWEEQPTLLTDSILIVFRGERTYIRRHLQYCSSNRNCQQYITSTNTVAANIKQVSAFPRKGKPMKLKKDYVREKQVTYRCKENPEMRKRCAQAPSSGGLWTGPTAYTQQPTLTGAGWETTFCPRFFLEDKVEYINRITERRRPHTEIFRLLSYEYVILHEWMHSDIFGFPAHIEDVVENIPFRDERRIYGDSLCYKFAWLYVESIGTGQGVNIHTAFNADSYAWFFNYNWFHYKWNWDSSGAFARRKRSIEGDEKPELYDDDLSDTVNAANLDSSKLIFPINCHMSDGDYKTVRCDYVGEEYKDFVKNVNEPFVAENMRNVTSPSMAMQLIQNATALVMVK
ncbi:hypothetical protein MferCBS31731_003503 [Microsporum ferrugineum]